MNVPDTAQAIQRLFRVFAPSSIELIEVDRNLFEFRQAGHHYVVSCPVIPGDALTVAEMINDEDCDTRFSRWIQGILLGARRDEAGNLHGRVWDYEPTQLGGVTRGVTRLDA